ncbi:hypothetical protein, partial [Rhizobium sp. Root1203]|uniref:hypothetical protein n=1 Tax=Rhizobium sp. Root1203 TaxID=1736427 RepID=UPI001AECC7F0
PNPKSANQSQSGNHEQKTSSPAAPPPSFSEGAYTAIPFSKSTAVFEKTEISIISLNSKRDFQTLAFAA